MFLIVLRNVCVLLIVDNFVRKTNDLGGQLFLGFAVDAAVDGVGGDHNERSDAAEEDREPIRALEYVEPEAKSDAEDEAADDSDAEAFDHTRALNFSVELFEPLELAFLAGEIFLSDAFDFAVSLSRIIVDKCVVIHLNFSFLDFVTILYRRDF